MPEVFVGLKSSRLTILISQVRDFDSYERGKAKRKFRFNANKISARGTKHNIFGGCEHFESNFNYLDSDNGKVTYMLLCARTNNFSTRMEIERSEQTPRPTSS